MLPRPKQPINWLRFTGDCAVKVSLSRFGVLALEDLLGIATGRTDMRSRTASHAVELGLLAIVESGPLQQASVVMIESRFGSIPREDQVVGFPLNQSQ